MIIGYSRQQRIELPAHSEPSNNQIRWQRRQTGFADISEFLVDGSSAAAALLARLQINGNGGDGANRAMFRVIEDAGDSLNTAGPNLSAAWVVGARAITLEVPGLAPLYLAGPNHAEVATGDATEPYSWIPGADYTNGAVTYTFSTGAPGGLAAWVADFKDADADAQAGAVLVLDEASS